MLAKQTRSPLLPPYWYRWKESNLHPHVRSMVSCSLNDSDITGAGEEIRTLDIYLGKVMLYQLSYARIVWCPVTESNCHYLITKQVFYH